MLQASVQASTKLFDILNPNPLMSPIYPLYNPVEGFCLPRQLQQLRAAMRAMRLAAPEVWMHVGFILGLDWGYIGFIFLLSWVYIGFMLGQWQSGVRV